ncbi:hypothetical protein V3C99_000037 [Haemonchus contortus]
MAEPEESTQDDLSGDVLSPSQGSAATPNTITPSKEPHALTSGSVGGAGETPKKCDFSNEVALEGKESSFSKETGQRISQEKVSSTHA